MTWGPWMCSKPCMQIMYRVSSEQSSKNYIHSKQFWYAALYLSKCYRLHLIKVKRTYSLWNNLMYRKAKPNVPCFRFLFLSDCVHLLSHIWVWPFHLFPYQCDLDFYPQRCDMHDDHLHDHAKTAVTSFLTQGDYIAENSSF